MRKQIGLTLIELMVVVAIIGIIASIASAQYQIYLARSKVVAAFSEISTGKVNFVTRSNNGDINNSPASIGLQELTYNCKTTVDTTSITCELQNTPSSLVGGVVTLIYSSVADQWVCTTSNIVVELRPETCS
ncbi:pilin [Chitinibacter tainanensis]|uniref:pilin n=1 Tax=Chitinibacter tainanensis TaxID=230667 RepID=UPI0005523563|nr:pilin [Chitinibacter tainanensis]